MTRVIEGFVPICMHCKSIREGEVWTPIESFVEKRTEAQVSHGLCPACLEKHYPDFAGEA